MNVIFFKNGYTVKDEEIQLYDYNSGQKNFEESLKRGEIPKDFSKHYDKNIDYHFQGKSEYGESLAWRNYQSTPLVMQEYDSNWPKLYQKEREHIEVTDFCFYATKVNLQKILLFCSTLFLRNVRNYIVLTHFC